jgi:hypothetical protein
MWRLQVRAAHREVPKHLVWSLQMSRAIPDIFREKPKSKRPVAHEFVLDALATRSPSTRPMFGCTAVYVDERVVFILRKRGDADDGVWVAFEPEKEAAACALFPALLPIGVLPNVRGWRKLGEKSPTFEEDVLRACALVRAGDPLLGKVPIRRKAKRHSGNYLR